MTPCVLVGVNPIHSDAMAVRFLIPEQPNSLLFFAGSSSSWVCMLLQHTALFGYGIAYTITASMSCRYARFHCILLKHARLHVAGPAELVPGRRRDGRSGRVGGLAFSTARFGTAGRSHTWANSPCTHIYVVARDAPCQGYCRPYLASKKIVGLIRPVTNPSQ